MDGGRVARRGDRGGDLVQAPRQARARVAAALGAVAGAGALTAWPALETAGREGQLLLGIGGLGALCVAAAVVTRLAVLVPLGLVFLGAEYAAGLAMRDAPLDQGAPVFGASLLVVAELAYWSFELRTAVADEAGAYLRRFALLSFHALVAVVAGAGLLALVHFGGRGGAAVDALGVAAAVAALALVAAAARRSFDGP